MVNILLVVAIVAAIVIGCVTFVNPRLSPAQQIVVAVGTGLLIGLVISVTVMIFVA